MANPTFRFAHQDDYTLAMLARVQRNTGYVPTMEELGQLLQCPTTGAARRRLEEMLIAGAGTRLTLEERQEMQAVAEREIDEQQSPTGSMRRRQRHTRVPGRPSLRWAREQCARQAVAHPRERGDRDRSLIPLGDIPGGVKGHRWCAST